MPHRLSTNNTTVIYLVSDGTGTTLQGHWDALRRRQPENGFDVRKFFSSAKANPENNLADFTADLLRCRHDFAEGTQVIVFYTVDTKDRATLIEAACQEVGRHGLNIVARDHLRDDLAIIEKATGRSSVPHGAVDHAEAERNISRVEAIAHAVQFDDGVDFAKGFAASDIVLLAPSRVGKSAVCVWIATHHGKKIINLPFVQGITDQQQIKELMAVHPNVAVLGMKRSPSDLAPIRESRSRDLFGLDDRPIREMTDAQKEFWQNQVRTYHGQAFIGQEMQAFEAMCADLKIPVVDVSRRATEDIAKLLLARVDGLR